MPRGVLLVASVLGFVTVIEVEDQVRIEQGEGNQKVVEQEGA